MNSKRGGITFFLLFLMYISTAGEYLNSGNEMAFDYAYLYALVDLIIASVSMMLIPFAIWIVRRKKFSYKKGKWFCICNSIIVFVVTNVIAIEFNLSAVGGLGAIIFYFINKWVFVDEGEPVQEMAENTMGDEFIKFENSSEVEEIPLLNTIVCDKCKKELPNNSAFCNFCRHKVRENTGKVNNETEHVSKYEAQTKHKNTTKKRGYLWIVLLIILCVLLVGIFLAFFVGGSNKGNGTNADDNTNSNKNTIEQESQSYEDMVSRAQCTIAEIVSYNTENYCKYIVELDGMMRKATYGEELKKEKASEYINNLTIEYGQKIILYRIQFPNDSTYNADIVEYLNERDDITYNEMVFVLEELGFAVFENGTVKW